MELKIKDKKQLPHAAKKILEIAGDKRIIAFYGPMGSGKTTIIKAVCSELGAVDVVSSPTFTLVNEYKTTNGDSLFHIDFYRIRKIEEVLDFGIEEYLTGETYSFLEWPELVQDILPDGILEIKISVGNNNERILDIS